MDNIAFAAITGAAEKAAVASFGRSGWERWTVRQLCRRFHLCRPLNPAIGSALLFVLLLPALFCSQMANAQTTPQLSELTLSVSDSVRQQRVADNIAVEAMVTAVDSDGNRIAVDGLVLMATDIDNTVYPQGNTATLVFAGSPPVGSARIEVALGRQAQNGQLQLELVNLPAGYNPAPPNSIVTVIAVEDYIARVDIEADYFTSFSRRDTERLRANWLIDGNRIFSLSDRTADIDTTGGRDPSQFLPELDIEFSLTLINGRTDGFQFPTRFESSTLRLMLQLTPGSGIEARLYEYVDSLNSIRDFGHAIEVVRGDSSLGRYRAFFTDSEPGVSARFTAAMSSAPRMATLTLTVSGLPPSVENHIATSQEFTLIDQALSTITLSATAATAQQSTPGEAVAVTVEVDARGTFGFAYVKALDLNLQVSASASALVSTSSVALSFRNNNPRIVTLRVTPTGLEDVELTVMPDRATSSLSEGVALVPEGGLTLTVRAARQLVRAQLRPLLTGTEVRQVDPDLPVNIDFEVSGFDQDGAAAEGQLIATATASIAGTTLAIDRTSLVLEEGSANFMLSVTPASLEPVVVTVSLTGLPPGQPQPTAAIRVIPTASRLQALDLNEDDAVDLDELLLIQRWLAAGRPDLTAGAMVGDGNLAVAPVTAGGYRNLLELYTDVDERLNVNGNGAVDELDIRILLRYRAGLRGAALGVSRENIPPEEQLRLLLGLR